jgi:hypothetical protein
MQARTLRTMRWNWATELSSISRDKIYTEHYLHYSPAAELSNEFDDHNRLYNLKGATTEEVTSSYIFGISLVLHSRAYNSM